MSVKLTIGFYAEAYKSFGIIFFLVVITVLAIYLFKKRFSSATIANTQNNRLITDLPVLLNFPFWTPRIIEGSVIAYRAYKSGVKVSFELWASKCYSPLAVLSTPNFQNVIFVSEPELIKKILGSLDSRLLDKPKFMYDRILTDVIKGGLFASTHDVWKRHRKILNKIFTYGELQKHLDVVDRCTQQLVTNLDAIDSSKIEFGQFRRIIYNTTLQIILEMLMGPKIVQDMGYEQIVERFRTLKYLIQYRFYYPHNMNDFLWKLNPKGKVYHECLSSIQDYFDDGIKRVIEMGEKESNCGAVQHMLTNNMSKKEIREEMATIIAAGHETTDLNIHLIMQHLGEHLSIQRKCQEEVDAVFTSKVSTNITTEDLTNLKYLEQCILETLRITPIAPFFGRELTGSIELDGLFLDKGTILLFCPWMVHRHPDYYPDADKFDPDRFSPDKVQTRHPYAFIPYSLGPRNCIGWKFSLMELKTMMFWVLRHYNVRTKDKLADIKMSFEMNVVPERKFNIWLEKRKRDM